MAPNQTYSAALERLNQIVADIESGEVPVDELSEKVAEASKLIRFCKDKLTKTDAEVANILKDLE